MQPFSSVETVHMQDYIKLTEPNFHLSLYILNIGSNNLSLQETPEAISKRIIATVKNHCKKTVINHSNKIHNDILTEVGCTFMVGQYL